MRARLFFPQTFFSASDVVRTVFLVDAKSLDRSRAIFRGIPGHSGRIWEYAPGWSCEALLRTCLLRTV